MTPKVYVGDKDTVITLNCGQDISAATVRTIEVRKPNGTLVEWSAQASGTNSLAYTSQADTFDQAGEWLLQPRVTLPSGGPWRGATASMMVYARFL